ncbi:MAG TPA: 50S ribosomal protein L19 [bacterium]|nr:50S ribosomal protein L19 [bacterium]
MEKLVAIERQQMKSAPPSFHAGDTIRVHMKVAEGGRDRLQAFEGIVLSRRGGGVREAFTVRRISHGVGVERTFPVHSPRVEKIEILRKGRVRRAKLYYLREKVGKESRVREKR